MPNYITLGPRLSACASFVPEGAALADIGTDHGYLPIYLLQSGRIRSAIAADVRKGPLQSAMANGEKYRVEMETILSDGFDAIPKDPFDTAVIAGMGGELMTRILSKAEYLRSGQIRLILQPMTSAHVLRRFLWQEGFCLEREKAVAEEGKIYTVMSVAYDGVRRKWEEWEAYMGKLEEKDCFSGMYAARLLSRLEKEKMGAEHREDREETDRLASVIEEIRRRYLLEETKGEKA